MEIQIRLSIRNAWKSPRVRDPIPEKEYGGRLNISEMDMLSLKYSPRDVLRGGMHDLVEQMLDDIYGEEENKNE